MESKAYPGEFFFFIRVNELLHGLGSRFDVDLGYLDALRPYAERGLRQSKMYDLNVLPVDPVKVEDLALQQKLESVLEKLKDEKELVGGQVCVLDKHGKPQADVFAGSLGGLRSHIPMQRNALILGYSTTKAVTATLAHIMVQEGFLSYDEPICERVWKSFCPIKYPPRTLGEHLGLPFEDVTTRWNWKRQITLRHILNHSAGLWSTFPAKLTIKTMASCEKCYAAYEYNPEAPEDTLLPTQRPGGNSEYHFMSFGWLVAGTLCGAYALKLGKINVSYEEVYYDLLGQKLSAETKRSGFRPLGGSGDFILSQTVTSDIRASKIMQRKREADTSEEGAAELSSSASEVFKTFQGKEFLVSAGTRKTCSYQFQSYCSYYNFQLDPRIWNSHDALGANVPAAGGRFSAAALAHFYHDLLDGKLLNEEVLNEVSCANSMETAVSGLQGVTHIANDSDNSHTKLCLGFQLIRTERDPDDAYSGVGHAGVGGSIGFWHKPTGLCIGVMLNKADGGQEVTMRILRAIGNHYNI
jgi:CubicO group peptidase (beta-lactamase class C family)